MTVEQTDEQLVEELKRGNLKALGDLYTRYGQAVRSALRRFVPEMNNSDADELCQDVFLILYETIGRYEERKKLKAWIFGIALKKARNWRRNTWLRRKILNRRADALKESEIELVKTPSYALQLKQEVEATLSLMSNKQREAMLLFSVEGFSCEEAAEILEIDIRTVWSRLHRARNAVLKKTNSIPVTEGIYQGEL